MCTELRWEKLGVRLHGVEVGEAGGDATWS